MQPKALIFVENNYEELELYYPKYRLKEAGFAVTVAGPKKEAYKGKHGYPCTPDTTLAEVKEDDFLLLVIPGGFAPDKLRRYDEVLKLTRAFHEKKKIIAFICHAGWVPISAKIIKDVKCTSTIAIKDDLINAGADWKDAAVVVDGHFISSRHPDDLPDFCRAILEKSAAMK